MGLIICPACGRQREMKPIPRKKFKCSNCGARSVRIIRRIKAWMDTGNREGLERGHAMEQTFAALRWLVRQHNYKIGWASVKFRTLFGMWPPDEFLTSGTESVAPSAELIHWTARERAAYAKMKRVEEAEEVRRKYELMKPSPLRAGPDGFVPGTLMTEEDFEVRL
jgi:hypothetical protein